MSARVHIASPAAVHLRQQVKAEVDLQIGKTIGLNLYNGVLGQPLYCKGQRASVSVDARPGMTTAEPGANRPSLL
jgi:hypothetical protein